MWPVLFNLGSVNITVFGLYLIVALLWPSFYIWRKLRSDATSNEIFEFTLYLFAMVLSGGVLAHFLDEGKLGISGWGSVVVGVFALLWWCRRKKWDFWEHFDWLSVLGILAWFWGGLAYGPGAATGIAGALVSLLVVGIVRSNYRRFRWYPSGRMGIVGLICLVCWSLYEISVAMVGNHKVYWGGLTAGQIVAAWVLAYVIVAIYLRGGGKLLWTKRTMSVRN